MTETIPSHLVPDFDPLPNPDAVVQRGRCRVTVLTPRLLRIEYGPDGEFEDRPSQPFWFRKQALPAFETGDGGSEKGLAVETEFLRLTLVDVEAPFAVNLEIELKESGTVWRYGDPADGNLGGTYRTLDTVDGAVVLERGLLSRDGWVVVDDSNTLVFNEDGWLEPRDPDTGRVDLYFFGHDRDFRAALADFRAVAGKVPLLPRWALGNWWSRYWAYTDAELRRLILDFEAHEVPLSVCIIDMDWHVTDTGNAASGWTGYTWNRDLFPEPDETLEFIHQHGLKTALNLHPADGVWPHEEQYAEFAEFMGRDPEKGEPVKFDLADPKFARAYFELLHHPEEARGVDFWWIDWQQGTLSGMPGLDPLWWLNHLHFYDLGRPRNGRMGERAGEETAHSPIRPFIFSRWGGLGNHRYPIGFSGDTVISWNSLSFQPHFTSTAANVGYGWWSHDIGGHYGGSPSAELYTRWVQYGVFSPILRLHSTRNPLLERRPFGWDAETFRITRRAMQLRHRLIPYLYTMAWRDHAEGEAPIRPMYHDHAEERAAYACPDQYTFGTELIAAPFTEPLDPDIGLARRVVWLPEERWNFLTGEHYPAGWHAVYGGLDDVPVFAKPGAIVPLCEPDDWRDPAAFEIHVFPGASNEFNLYEDDGVSTAYRSGDYTLTKFSIDWSRKKTTFNIEPVDQTQGRPGTRPRTYTLVFHAVTEPESIAAAIDGEDAPAAIDYDSETGTLTVSPPDLAEGEGLEIVLEGLAARRAGEASMVATLQRMVRAFRAGNDIRQVLIDSIPEIVADPVKLLAFKVSFKDAHLRALLEVLLGAGVYTHDQAGEQVVVAWNRDNRPEVTYDLSTEHHRTWLSSERFRLERERVPPFKAWHPERDFADVYWLLTVRLGEILQFSI